MKKMKYVLVTGGVASGLGKGVTASSIGVLLKACGLRVTSIKIDPYLNTDAGTMSPSEHGEVFVLDDGGEVDLDLGNYERFLDIKLTRDHNITTGKIYQNVIDKERRGDYLGKTVQVVPHITDAIQEWIERVAMVPVDGQEGPADVCVIELGGNIGDIESMPFIEALGQFSYRVGFGNFCLIHVSLVPVLNVVGEQKTKQTQHSVQGLRGLGLTPNILACRSTKALDDNVKVKLSQFCHVPAESIITVYDVPNIWHIPLLLRDQKAHEAILRVLNLQGIKEPALEEWTSRAKICDMLHEPVRIAMDGKYTGLSDSYLSVLKALLHASVARRKKLIVDWVPASDLEDATEKENPDAYKAAWKLLKGADGVLVPGGFGDMGVQGKILAAKYARENRIPFLGICLGTQIAVIEFARSVLGLKDANSTEFDSTTRNPCVIFIPEGSKTHMGGTMRLGSRRTYFQVMDCKSAKLYGNISFIEERHRHRYEVNPHMITCLENAGLSFTGKDETGRLMETSLFSTTFCAHQQTPLAIMLSVRNKKIRKELQKRRMKKMKLSIKRIKLEMANISADQKSIRKGQLEVTEKFKETECECAQLGEETNLISQHAKGTRMRLDLMLEILEAREDKDFVKTHNLTNSLRELIASQDEKERAFR